MRKSSARRLLGLVCLSVLLCAAVTACTPATPGPAATPAADVKQTRTVYATPSGSKFHRAGCRFLKESKKAMDHGQALAQGLSACGVCKP